MFRTAKSLSKLRRPSQGLLSNARLSTSATQCSSGGPDGEPEFLEMVRDFADNAHSLALDKLLSAKPPPGKRAEESSIREKHIRGDLLMFTISFIARSAIKYITNVVLTVVLIHFHFLN